MVKFECNLNLKCRTLFVFSEIMSVTFRMKSCPRYKHQSYSLLKMITGTEVIEPF